tara:strand:- start:1387 stop:2169 length:783 start_codon:yes stop_codon:yes gene_type:complete
LDGLPHASSWGEVFSVQTTTEGGFVKNRGFACGVCGTMDCPVFNEEFINDKRDVYLKCAEKIGESDTLIVSDKLFKLYKKTLQNVTVPVRVLLLHKKAIAGIKSLMAHDDLELEEAIQWYQNYYKESIKFYNLYGGYVLNIEKFISDPEEELKMLCESLDLDCDVNALNYWEHEHHQIGGNNGAYISVLGNKGVDKFGTTSEKMFNFFGFNEEYYNKAFHKLKKDETWKQFFSDEQKELIMNDERVIRIVERLEKLKGEN